MTRLDPAIGEVFQIDNIVFVCERNLNNDCTGYSMNHVNKCKYYAISDKWEVLETFSSTEQADKYIKDHSDIFQIIYRNETSINGEVYYGPFRVYYSHNDQYIR